MPTGSAKASPRDETSPRDENNADSNKSNDFEKNDAGGTGDHSSSNDDSGHKFTASTLLSSAINTLGLTSVSSSSPSQAAAATDAKAKDEAESEATSEGIAGERDFNRHQTFGAQYRRRSVSQEYRRQKDTYNLL